MATARARFLSRAGGWLGARSSVAQAGAQGGTRSSEASKSVARQLKSRWSQIRAAVPHVNPTTLDILSSPAHHNFSIS